METGYTKIYASGCSAPLKVKAGHFATNHSHINYYIDMTTLKTRVSEAQEAAKSLAGMMLYDKPVDTIVCMDGTEVIGGFLAEELSKAGVMSMNAHKTIYVISPEFNSNSQIVFRENILPMIKGKNILLLLATVTTGLSLNKGVEAIQYYGGVLSGVSSIFSAQDEVDGYRISSIFTRKELPDYTSADYRDCPMCKAGRPLNGLVNAYGYSNL